MLILAHIMLIMGPSPPHKYNSKKLSTTINKVHAALIAREYLITSNLY